MLPILGKKKPGNERKGKIEERVKKEKKTSLNKFPFGQKAWRKGHDMRPIKGGIPNPLRKGSRPKGGAGPRRIEGA